MATSKYKTNKDVEKEHQRDIDQSRRVYRGTDAEVSKARKAVEREYAPIISAIDKEAAAEEKSLLSKPITRFTGGTHNLEKPLVVRHWNAALPADKLNLPAGKRVSDKHGGPLLALQRGGGITKSSVVAPRMMGRFPSLRADADYKRRVGEALRDVMQKYRLLEHLRDDRRMAGFFREVGLTAEVKTREDVEGEYGRYTREVTTVQVPTLLTVTVGRGGLEMTYAHMAGRSSSDWNKRLPELRAAFKNMGVNADSLTVHDTDTGDVLLRFDDAEVAFPAAVSLEPPSRAPSSVDDGIKRYSLTRWMLGVDALGDAVAFPLETFPHVQVVGGTGGGKSVWARSVIETLRTGYRDPETGRDAGGGWACFISDGKGSDFAALEGKPGVVMVTPGTDVAQTAAMIRRVRLEVERRFERIGDAKRRGDADPFVGMQPWLLLLDEWGSTAISMRDAYGKSADSFERDIDRILRLGRECRVHCALLSQTIRKTGDGAVPGSWQENLGLTVSLGSPSEITLQSDAFTPDTRERAAVMGSKLKGKRGRGLIVDRMTSTVKEFQSYYIWSPGTTSLAPDAAKSVAPPSAEMREVWERWEPISASVPWLSPRVGIAASGPEWRDALDTVYGTSLVPLTDRDGHLRAGMETADPTRAEWLGRRGAGDTGGAAVHDFGFDAPTAKAEPTPAPPRVEPGPPKREPKERTAAAAEPEPAPEPSVFAVGSDGVIDVEVVDVEPDHTAPTPPRPEVDAEPESATTTTTAASSGTDDDDAARASETGDDEDGGFTL